MSKAFSFKQNVSKWGNSLAIRIPSPLADYLGIECGTTVKLVHSKDGFIVKIEKQQKLEELVKNMETIRQ